MMNIHRYTTAMLGLALVAGLAAGPVHRAHAELPAPGSPAAPPPSFTSVVAPAKAAVVSVRLPSPPGAPVSPETPDEDGLAEGLDEIPLGELVARLLAERAGAVIGAGVIVDDAGTTLTSARVARLARDFEVVMDDGAAVKAEVAGIDDRTDLAILRLDPSRRPYPHLRLGNSDEVNVGDWVIAIGAPYGLVATVTAGIISATARPTESGPYAEFLQTDAALGAGSAGGPLLNTKGEAIGIATDLGGDGVGFAVPSNTAKKVAADVREWGRVRRAWLGVSGQPLTPALARGFRRPDTRGILIADVEPAAPAAVAGLRPGDILLGFDGRPLRGSFDLDRALASSAPGQTVRLGIWRAGRLTSPLVVLGDEPDRTPIPPGLGLALRALGPGLGVVVTAVDPKSAAARAGVHRGDVIREVDQQPIRNLEDFERLAKPRRGSAPLVVLLQRGATALYVALPRAR